jgi:hypothetical protein
MMTINFSEPTSQDQDFSGLVSIENARNLKFSTDGLLNFNNQTIASSEKDERKFRRNREEEAVDSSTVEAADIDSVTVVTAAQLLHMSNQVVTQQLLLVSY